MRGLHLFNMYGKSVVFDITKEKKHERTFFQHASMLKRRMDVLRDQQNPASFPSDMDGFDHQNITEN